MGQPNQRTLLGVVSAFDEHKALGEVTDDTGTVWPFHCVSIADGSRTVAIGAQVQFETKFHVSRDEAVNIRPR